MIHLIDRTVIFFAFFAIEQCTNDFITGECIEVQIRFVIAVNGDMRRRRKLRVVTTYYFGFFVKALVSI